MTSTGEKIFVAAFFTVCVTIIVILLIALIIFTLYYEDFISWYESQYNQLCENTEIEYSEAVKYPMDIERYEKNLALALYQINNAVSLANCPDKVLILPPGFNQAVEIRGIDPASGRDTMFAYIFYDNEGERAVVSFTGTFYLSEWLDDLNYAQVAPTELNGYVDGQLVHGGFYRIYVNIRQQIIDFINDNEVSELYITGHSLGGALAILCGYDLSESKSMVHYTFGAPRVGNTLFTLDFNKAVPQSMRVNNTEDLIPALPPAYWDGWTFFQNNNNIPFTISLGTLLADHTQAYMKHMPECFDNRAPCHTQFDFYNTGL